jgi:hypothetical protein
MVNIFIRLSDVSKSGLCSPSLPTIRRKALFRVKKDTIRAIKSRKSKKDRQYNGKK